MRKRAGVKGFRFHDVRHDMATKLLRQTNNLKLVSRALNHADIKTTSRYAHVLTARLRTRCNACRRQKVPRKIPRSEIKSLLTK